MDRHGVCPRVPGLWSSAGQMLGAEQGGVGALEIRGAHHSLVEPHQQHTCAEGGGSALGFAVHPLAVSPKSRHRSGVTLLG